MLYTAKKTIPQAQKVLNFNRIYLETFWRKNFSIVIQNFLLTLYFLRQGDLRFDQILLSKNEILIILELKKLFTWNFQAILLHQCDLKKIKKFLPITLSLLKWRHNNVFWLFNILWRHSSLFLVLILKTLNKYLPDNISGCILIKRELENVWSYFNLRLGVLTWKICCTRVSIKSYSHPKKER